MRAGVLLAIVGAVGLAAVAFLLIGPGGDSADDGRAPAAVDTGGAAATPDLDRGSPDPRRDTAATVAPVADPAPAQADRAAADVDAGPRIPRTLQSLHGRVTAPANLALAVRARVVDRHGVVCEWALPDPDGSLVLELTRPVDQARIEFEHPALAALTMAPYDVEAGVRRGFGVARLVPSRVVTGTAQLSSGAPAVGARVFVLPAAGRLDAGVAEVTVDADGNFELTGVPPRHGGVLVLHAEGAAHVAELPPPAEPLALTLEHTGRGFDVVVHDGEGRAVAGARIDLLIGTTTLASVASGADGRARLAPLPPVAFDVEAYAPGRAPARADGLVPRDAESNVDLILAPTEVDVTDDPEDGDGGRDRGWLGFELTDADGRALAGAQLELWSRAPGALELHDLPGRRHDPDRTTRSDHRGWALWKDLADGPWWIVARADGYLPALEPALRAREDDPEPPLWALEPAATIRGVVTTPGGAPVLGTAVDLTSSADRGSPLRVRLTTDARGRFEVRDVPAGSWIARALAPSGFTELGASESSVVDVTVDEPAVVELVLPIRG